MKLFYYDEKHNQIHDSLELGNLNEEQKELLDQVIDWLDKKEITNRYRRLTLAQTGEVLYEDGDAVDVVFEDKELCEKCGEPKKYFMQSGQATDLTEVFGCPYCDN